MGPLRGEEVIVETNGPLGKQMEGMVVCEKVCLSVVSASRLPSCDKSQSSLVDETPQQRVRTIELL